MEIKVQYNGGARFDAVARGHRVVCDQPQSHGGADEGMTPPEFLLVSLGTCAGFYAAQYLKIHSLPAEGLEVRVSAEKAKAPARLGRMRIEVSLAQLAPEHEAGVQRAVHACLVHNTLLHTPEIETVIHAPALA
jgi:uncharacterized OsmC-like protein